MTLLRLSVALAALFLALNASSGISKAADSPVVLFDESHSQRFLVGETASLSLSAFAELFRMQGFQVATRKEPLTAEALSGVSALVISGPFAPITASEIEAVTGFLERDGSLAVMLHYWVAPHTTPRQTGCYRLQ